MLTWQEILDRTETLAKGLPCGCNGDRLCFEAQRLQASKTNGYYYALGTNDWTGYDQAMRVFWAHWNLPTSHEQAVAFFAAQRENVVSCPYHTGQGRT